MTFINRTHALPLVTMEGSSSASSDTIGRRRRIIKKYKKIYSAIEALPLDIKRVLTNFLDMKSYLCLVRTNVYMYSLTRDNTLKANYACDINRILRSILDEKRNVFITGSGGSGKCLAPDTPVLLWNGTTKRAKDVVVGDQLIGDDNSPRNVLSTCSGRDNMYQVSQTNGDDYVVNEKHILSVKSTLHKSWYWSESKKQYHCFWFDPVNLKLKRHKFTVSNDVRSLYYTQEEARQALVKTLDSIPDNDVFDIPVKDYLNIVPSARAELRGFKASVDWPSRVVFLEPYLLGAWLGDGNSNGAGFTQQDNECLREVDRYLHEMQCELILAKGAEYYYRLVGITRHENQFRRDRKSVV